MVADSIALGEDALEAIVVDIEPLPAVVDRDAARRGATLLFEETGSNFAGTLVATRGDTDAAFKNAPYTRREFLNVRRHGAVPMEPRGLDGGLGRRKAAHHGQRRLQGAVQNAEGVGRDDGFAGKRGTPCSNTTSAAASARAASSIPKIF